MINEPLKSNSLSIIGEIIIVTIIMYIELLTKYFVFLNEIKKWFKKNVKDIIKNTTDQEKLAFENDKISLL